MTSRAWRSASFACLFYFGGASLAWCEIYQISNYPNLQNGLAVSGNISASDLNSDMRLESAELSSWSLTINGHTSTSADPLAGSLLANVSIRNGQIFLEDAALSGIQEQFILAIDLDEFVNYSAAPFSNSYNDQVYNGRAGSVPSPTWTAETVLTNGPNLPMPVSNGRMIIATLVPEPKTLALLGIGVLVLGGAKRYKGRRPRML